MLIQCLHGILNGGIEGRKRSDKHFAHHFGGVIKFVAIVEVVHEKLARDAE